MVPSFWNPGLLAAKTGASACFHSEIGNSDRAGAHRKRQPEVRQKTKRTGPGEPGPMRFQQGLLPCQFIVRCWLPVFSDGRLGR
jgi:hypothetical protein